MFGSGGRELRPEEIYEKAGRRMLSGDHGWGFFQLDFQRSLDRHSAAMERMAAAIEKSNESQ